MADNLSLAYFIGITILSSLSFVFAIIIYRSTRKATKGWLYLSLFIGLNAALTLIGLLREFVIGSDAVTRIVHGFLSLAVGVILLTGTAILLRDFGMKDRWMPVCYIIFFLGLSVFALTNPLTLRLFTGFTHYALSASLILASVSFFLIYRVNKEIHWAALGASTLTDGVSLFALAYLQGCCNHLTSEGCSLVSGISETPFPQYCSSGMVGWYVPVVWMSIISFIIAVIAYYLVYRSWKKAVYS